MMTTAELKAKRAKRGFGIEKEVLIESHAFAQRALSQAVIMEHKENMDLFRSHIKAYETRINEITH
ncbi:hypothetical protein Ah1_00129 [Aeromonas phage Ah1]|uniref:Uncharacterized protein n=1 Tax=Aeromonas phage Ah1 TaxID=2053701 RepID=A0A2H4YES8_9CAUD|nr:hypothetical protein KNT77_gp129 [Aeromonas phage Ah1]AUE22670.1 hypothetical protein Ah1_00129 [Aeromonas phage Ah1]UYD60265.1 hypothetical protein OPFAMLBM_00266 [Aeromonas phage avDM12-TAAL]